MSRAGSARATPNAPRLGRNAAAGGARFVVSAVLALAVTPYAFEHLGATRFGIWALAGGVVTAVRLLDLGVARALTREVAMAAAPGLARPSMAAALGLAVVIGTAAVAAVAALALPLVRFVDVPPQLVTEAAIAIVGSAVVAALEGLFTPHASALDGIGRTDLSSGVDSTQRVLSALGVVAVLAPGWGLPGLVAKNAVLAIGAGVVYRIVLSRAAPELAGVLPGLPREPATRLLSFGRHVQAVNVGALLTEPLNKVILGRAAGLEAVAGYEIAVLVASQVGGAFLAATQALFPEAARRAGAPVGRDGTAEFLRQAEVVVALAAVGLFTLLAALASAFVAAWIAPGYEQVATAIAILSAGWVLAVIATPSFLVAQGVGRPGMATTAGTVTAIASTLLAVVLAPVAGAVGVASARAIGLAAGAAIMWRLMARSLGRQAPSPSTILPTLVAAAVGAAAARWLVGILSGAGLIGVALAGAVGLAIYAAIAIGARLVRREPPTAAAATVITQPPETGDLTRASVPTRRAIANRQGACRGVVAVVPTWNAVERLPEALGALADQVDAVVAVDNGSQDGTADWLLRWQAESPAARVILERPRNDGYAAATNAGAERALALGADAVLLVNDDAVFGAGAVALLCAALGADATLAAVSAKMLYADRPDILNGTGGRWDAERALATLRGDGETDLAQYDQAQRADYPSGAASLIGANAWRDVGPMDETYYLYYEDVDWGLRARQRGWEIGFVAGAVVHHAGSAGTRAAPERRRYYNVRNRCAFAGRYAPARGRTWAAAATLVLLAKQPARWLSPARRADAEAVALGVWDRLLGRTGRSPRFG